MEFYLSVTVVHGKEARLIYEVVESMVKWETPIDYDVEKYVNKYIQFKEIDGNWPLRWIPWVHRYLKRVKGKWGDKVSLENLEALGFSPMTDDELQSYFDSLDIIYDGGDYLPELLRVSDLSDEDNPKTLLIIPALFAVGLGILYLVE